MVKKTLRLNYQLIIFNMQSNNVVSPKMANKYVEYY